MDHQDGRRVSRRSGAPGTKLRSEGEAVWDAGEGASWLQFLPWSELPRAAFEDDTDAIQAWLRAPHTDPWQLDVGMRDITVPNLDFTGWFDHASGDFGTFRALVRDGGSRTSRERSRIVIGPWAHSGYRQSRFGAIDFGEEGLLDGVGLMIRWFDHWLKGEPNGIDADPRVLLFTMGDNRWRGEAGLAAGRDARMGAVHREPGHANTPAGDGVLVASQPVEPAATSTPTTRATLCRTCTRRAASRSLPTRRRSRAGSTSSSTSPSRWLRASR